MLFGSGRAFTRWIARRRSAIDGRYPSFVERSYAMSQTELGSDWKIQSHHDDGFTVNNVRYRSPLVLLPKMLLLWKILPSVREIRRKDVIVFAACFPPPELVVIGTGPRLVPITPDLRLYFKELGIMTDVMDTRSACSTFNVLSQEGRLVGACLLPSG
jgi:NADH dehydrogenase [ubiquinone] 1 alpha subcomplex assembly factor 3